MRQAALKSFFMEEKSERPDASGRSRRPEAYALRQRRFYFRIYRNQLILFMQVNIGYN